MVTIWRRIMWDEAKLNGNKYLTCNSLIHGDYCGSGTVGLSNLNVLKQDNEYELMRNSLFERIRTQLTYHEDDAEWDQILDDHNGPPKKILIHHPYSTSQMWLLECEDNEDTIAGLSNYPLICDHEHSMVELAWEEEAWDQWVRGELYSTLDEDLQDAIEEKKPTDAKLYEAYRLAMESTNTYPVHETAGTYVDTGRIKDEYNDNVRLLLT